MLVKWYPDLFDSLSELGSHIVDVNNVAKWFYQDNEQEYYHIDDFPILAPPWPHAFLEFKQPKYTYSKEMGRNKPPSYLRGARYGGVFWGMRISESEIKNRHYSADVLLDMVKARHYIGKFPKPTYDNDFLADRDQRLKAFQESGENPGWVISIDILIGNKRHKSMLGSYITLLDNYGTPIKGIGINMSTPPNTVVDAGQQAIDAHQHFFSSILSCFAFAISLMHCKSQIYFKEYHDSFRRNQGSGRYQGFKYKTLIVRPLQEQIRRESGNNANNHIKRALHFVRGNFANYTDKAPLFGKYIGTFWRPAHLRGDEKVGIIDKDYKVEVDKS